MMMSDGIVLLTGATGFVGKRFVEYNRDSIQVKTLSFQEWENNDTDVFKNVKTVVHLAGIAHRMEKTDPDLYFSINYQKTSVFADVAKKMGVKHFIFISTIKAFGEHQNGVLNEDSPTVPINDPYGESKLKAEEYLKSIEDDHFIVSIIRPPLIYGPGVKGNLIKFLDLANKPVPLPFKHVSNRRTMIFLDNFIELINTIVERKKSGIFLAGDAYPISTEYLISEIRKNLQKPKLLFKMPSIIINILGKFKPELIMRLFGSLEMDVSNSYKRLGFKPPFTTKYGIKQMVDWYQKNKKNS